MSPETSEWTILDVLKWTAGFFGDRQVEGAQLSAELLLAHTLGLNRLDLYLRYDQPLSAEELSTCRELIKRRAAGEPVAYIVGEKAFWSMTLSVTPEVLIPRPDTECLVETALACLPAEAVDADAFRVMEPGTGSGAVVLAMAGAAPHCHFFAFDRSPAAVAVARDNARRQNLLDHVAFFVSDWFSAFRTAGERFDLIVVNPPYIAAAEIDGLAPEIRRFEPRDALDGGQDGLQAIRHIVAAAPDFLKPAGRLMLEIGWDQKNDVAQIAAETDAYASPEFVKDLAGHHRVVNLRVR
ncbi:MAG: peptide chain release factor N(5)-glutamine methyltransferase [Thermodesulfobacteriota bacterium]|nr:peptide chain release factor N(5)-glutamine methyltransferase [Thermodesulfobacteriota bacterium]